MSKPNSFHVVGYLGGEIPMMQNNEFIVPHIVRECVLNIEKSTFL